MPAQRRIPPLEIREGEMWLVAWEKGGDVHFQLRTAADKGQREGAHANHPEELLRRPPSASVADLIRAEMLGDIERDRRQAKDRRFTPKRPRWPK